MDSNELLSKVLAENIEKASNGVGSAIDFTLDQAPEIIHQALMWNMAISGIKFMSAIVIFILLLAAIASYVKSFKNNGDGFDDHPELMFTIFPFMIPLALFNFTWLKIWIAPKVWLIEYAAGLVK